VDVERIEQLPHAEPASPDGRIHDLDKAAMTTPDDDEMGEAVGLTDDHDRRQGPGLGHQQVVHWQHHLLGLEAELHGDLLYRVN
jgi:hypothetical protein